MAGIHIFGLVLLFSSTVFAKVYFNAKADAETLHGALINFNSPDREAIIQLVSERSHEERHEINLEYQRSFGRGFDEEIQSKKYDENFQLLLAYLMQPRNKVYATFMHSVENPINVAVTWIKGYNYEKDLEPLISMMCTVSNKDKAKIVETYESINGKSSKSIISSASVRPFKHLINSFISSKRDESLNVDKQAARRQADEIKKSVEEKTIVTDATVLISTLVETNIAQLKEIFSQYQNITGHDIEKAIEKKFVGDDEKAFLTAVKCAKNKTELFADEFNNALSGYLTINHNEIMRLVVTRAGIDIDKIKESFEKNHGKPLRDKISEKTSGSYKDLLLALIK